LTGGSDFNGELFGAEHLVMEDEMPSTDIRVRRQFGAQIKSFVVNKTNSLHAKHKQALTMCPFWRLSISVNDSDEHLMVLPPMDQSLMDKIHLFRVYYNATPSNTWDDGEYQKWPEIIRSELPGYLHYLLNEFNIPADLRDQRYGIASYQDPGILELLNEMSPESRLLELIDTFCIPDPKTGQPWEGTAAALEDFLSMHCHSQGSKSIFKYTNSCGNNLGKLAKQYPNRISNRKSNGRVLWCIKPAEQESSQR
jgi:hypothetical protein